MRNKINRFVAVLLSTLMGVMLLSVLWQVFTRYIIGEASTITEEISRFGLIWIGLLGAAYVSGENAHMAIDLLPSRLNHKNKNKLQILINTIIILFALIALVIGGGRLVYISFLLGQTSASLQVPLGYVYLVIPLSGMLIMYYKCMDILRSFNV